MRAGPSRAQQSRALSLSLVVNGGFLIAEVVGAVLFNSLALLADAAHMLSDVVGLGVALLAQRLITRPASARHTYGFQRAEVLGAQANGVLLLAAAGWIFYEAAQRLGDPQDVAGLGLLLVASMGLLINIGSAIILARNQGASLNMRGAFLHMAVDALGSVGAIVAAVGVLVWDADWVDPLVSIAIGLLVLWSAWRLLRDTAHVLLEGTPRGLEPTEVETALQADGAVASVHHLHLWNLASDVPALSAHVVVHDEDTLHDAQAHAERLKVMLRDRFGIEHATLELECHACHPSYETERAYGHRS